MAEESKDNDELDGCDLVFTDDEMIKDDDVDGVVLFAGIDPLDEVSVAIKQAEWEELNANGLRPRDS